MTTILLFARPGGLATPEAIAKPPGSPWLVVGTMRRRRRRGLRKQKRGFRAGAGTANQARVFLTNARSIVNKTDGLQPLLANNNTIWDCWDVQRRSTVYIYTQLV